MKVNIYINNKRIEDYKKEDLQEVALKLNIEAFKSIGYVLSTDKK